MDGQDGAAGVRIDRWDGPTARARWHAVWSVYDPVFGDRPDADAWREEALEPHSRRDDFVLVAALDGGADDRLVGFAWAYTGHRGEWFSDRAAEALGAERAQEWVGGHLELVELAVLEAYRGRSLGSRLHDAVVADADGRTALLATDAGDTPAARLYEHRGWVTLAPFGTSSRLMGLPPAPRPRSGPRPPR